MIKLHYLYKEFLLCNWQEFSRGDRIINRFFKKIKNKAEKSDRRDQLQFMTFFPWIQFLFMGLLKPPVLINLKVLPLCAIGNAAY